MTLVGFLLLLVIAGLSGGIAQAMVGFSRSGCFVSIAVGFIGAFFGWWISRFLGLPPLLVITIQGEHFPIVWAIIGGTIFVTIINMVTGKR